VSDEEIARCAQLAFDRGWSAVKLYFMIGLPGETLDDVLAIAAISRRVLQMGQRRQRRPGRRSRRTSPHSCPRGGRFLNPPRFQLGTGPKDFSGDPA